MSNQISLYSYFYDAHYFKAALQISDLKEKDMTPGQVWCPILRNCALHFTHTRREHKPGAVLCCEHHDFNDKL